MTITPLSPLNPLNVPAAEGGVAESRPEETTEALPRMIQPVAAPLSPSQTQNAQPPDRFQPSQADLIDAVAQAFGTQVRFAVNNESHQIIVQVYDVETKEVIREIPPEQIVKVLSKIMDARDAKGLLLDERA